MLKYLIWTGLFLSGQQLMAQATGDSLGSFDTVIREPVKKRVIRKPVRTNISISPVNSLLPNTRRDTIPVVNHSFWHVDSFLYTKHPFFSFSKPIRYPVSIRQWQGKEVTFYALIGLLIFFALIKNGFYRYILDLLKVFFRTTVRQRQLKDQLTQSPLPSLLLNIFFLLSVGMFLALLLTYFKLGLQYNFWMLFLYCVAGLLIIYSIKFIVLKFIGWALEIPDATEVYIFVVFTTNKIMGIALLPFLIVLALTYGTVSQLASTAGIGVIIGLFAYRYFLSYISIHRQLKISFFHFLVYLCAFEIAPVLLINKLLFTFLT